MYGRARGTVILGTAGSIVIDQDGWVLSDIKGKKVRESVADEKGDALNTTGDDALTELHMKNFLSSIRTDVTAQRAALPTAPRRASSATSGSIAHQVGHLKAAHRSEDRTNSGRRGRGETMVADLRARVGAIGVIGGGRVCVCGARGRRFVLCCVPSSSASSA